MWKHFQTLSAERLATLSACGQETNSFPQSHRGAELSRLFHRNITDNDEVRLPESGTCAVSDRTNQVLDLDLKTWFGPHFILDLLDGVHDGCMVPTAEFRPDLGG